MSANSSDLLGADRPIPLGRPSVPTGPAVEPQPIVLVPDADVEPSLVPAPAVVVDKPEVVPAMASTTPVPAVGAVPARPATQPAGNPIAGLRGFRLDPIPVEPLYSGRRDLVRFLVQFALVMAFVYALIVAFVLLVAHLRGTPA